MKTLAQRIHRFGPPDVIELESIDLPRAGPGETLIKVLAAGVGPWDALIRSGKSALPQPLPLTIGADIAGIVLAVGEEATHLVAGICVYGVTNARFVGGYANHAIVDAHRVAEKPSRLDFVSAAGLPVVAVTAWKMLFERGRLETGQRVLIHGASGNVGGLAIQMARGVAADVVAIGAAGDAELLSGLGASTVLDYSTPFENHVDPVDLVIDTIGGQVQQRSLSVLKKGGTLISIVNRPDSERTCELGVRGEFFVVDVTTPDIERISRLIHEGSIEPSVSEVLPLADARQAHMLLERPKNSGRGKIILSMDS